MKLRLVLPVMIMIVHAASFAQSPRIENYISMIEGGQAELVRTELPSLLRKFPNNPGILYVQAALTTDGAEAARAYQNIVDTYPKSEWADDALYKLYKFYYAIGLFRTADLKLNQLKTDYPNSKYVAGLASTDPKSAEAKPESAPPPATRNAQPAAPKTEESIAPKATEGVRQDPPPVGTPQPAISQPKSVPGKFTLQVGAFSTRANAEKQKLFFAYHNYPVEVVSKMSGRRELYVVYVGSFSTEDEAHARGNAIRSSFNMNYIVVAR